MRRIIIALIVLMSLAIPVQALDITAPTVPQSGEKLMPKQYETFGDGLLEVIHDALCYFHPDLKEAGGICCAVIAGVMSVSLFQNINASSATVADLAGTATVAAVLLRSSHTLIRLGIETVTEISSYSKLLLPALTAALAAQGSGTTAAALYAGTACFDAVLTGLIAKLLTPLIYVYLSLAIGAAALEQPGICKLRDMVKWAMTWGLKIVLYLFTGYIAVTGVVSGGTDAAALKAAKLTISGMVPVVGGILADASEAVLVSAGTIKNAAGIYGLLAVCAVCAGPFLRIGAHYLLLKLTAALCQVFGSKRVTDLVWDFSAAMGLVLAMVGAGCLMVLISTVCFLKGGGL